MPVKPGFTLYITFCTSTGYASKLCGINGFAITIHYNGGSRAQKVALALLNDFQGALQTDGYAVYKMYEDKKGVLPLGCWAHARHKFQESLKNDKARAKSALEQIDLLYEVEREADDKNLSYDEKLLSEKASLTQSWLLSKNG